MKNKNKNPVDNLTKDIRTLLNHISLIERKCRENGLFLSAGIDPYKPLDNVSQQGPMVTKLFELTKNLRTKLNK